MYSEAGTFTKRITICPVLAPAGATAFTCWCFHSPLVFIKRKLFEDNGIADVGFTCVNDGPFGEKSYAVSIVVKLSDAVIDEIIMHRVNKTPFLV
jgi:hypothetical protein